MNRQGANYTPTAIDLFAGGGGLTLGLKRAGFGVIGAVESERHAFATYKANHPEVQAFRQDIRTVRGDSLLKLGENEHIDLIAGCPPCQGFSSLTSKYRRDDPRNLLVREMSRLIEETLPRAVMMENVPGLADKGQKLFDELLDLMGRLGYKVSHRILQVADYGVPQSRRRLVLLAGRGFEISFPEPTHAQEPTGDLKPWRSVKTAIKGLPRPITLAAAREHGGPEAFGWHVVRSLSPANLKRIRSAVPGASRSCIPKNLRPKCHRDEDKGFSNVYGRMHWDFVSPTITGGCSTLSKGRFGHPVEDRTISVREAALLQTFPKDYIFDTPYMEYVCNIVGNALPCDFAEVLGRQCLIALTRSS